MTKEEIALELTKLVSHAVVQNTVCTRDNPTNCYAETLTDAFNYFMGNIKAEDK